MAKDDRTLLGNQQVGFGKWSHILIKDSVRSDPRYAEWLVANFDTLFTDRARQVARYCVQALEECRVREAARVAEREALEAAERPVAAFQEAMARARSAWRDHDWRIARRLAALGLAERGD